MVFPVAVAVFSKVKARYVRDSSELFERALTRVPDVEVIRVEFTVDHLIGTNAEILTAEGDMRGVVETPNLSECSYAL